MTCTVKGFSLKAMKNHYSLTDSQFENQFATAVLDPTAFTHEAHLRLAWVHLSKYGLEKAIENITAQLKNYTEVVGAAAKYNETVTIAAVYAVNHFMILSRHTDFPNFIDENSQLKTNFRDLINTHYRTDIFKSEQAKASFLKPELLPFD
jgi:hypothetical protein